MSTHVEQTIADLVQETARMETDLNDNKRLVNKLCTKIGKLPPYPDTERATEVGIGNVRRDQWYGQSISTSIREYLSIRRAANLGPATVNEIYDALVSGGFAFEARDADNAKRGIRICLTKNTSLFHRLPDDKHYGLIEWYPEAKTRKERETPEEGARQEPMEAALKAAAPKRRREDSDSTSGGREGEA